MHGINNWQDKTVWITGASSGIGQALALRLDAAGAQVYASARNASALAEMSAGTRIIALPCDVTHCEDMRHAANNIGERSGHLDVLVCNAGTCEYVDVQHFDSALFARVMATNFLGAVHSVDAALPLLRKGKTRVIAGVGSTAAWTGLPRAEAYGASKAALHYFLESLRVDLTREHFRVVTIAPGFVKTPLTDRNDFAMPMRIGVEDAVNYLLDGLRSGSSHIDFPPAFTAGLKVMRCLPAALRNRLYQRLVNEE